MSYLLLTIAVDVLMLFLFFTNDVFKLISLI